MHGLRARRLSVSRVTPLVPGMVRLTFVGPDLDGFTAPGPADHVKLVVPGADGVLHAPSHAADGSLVRPGPDAHVRDYTPRAYREGPGGGELDIDVVLHGDDGPVSAFAAHAQVGDEVAILGPRGSRLPFTGADHVLIGGDETALPAMARWLAAIDPSVPVRMVVEHSRPGAERYLDDALRPGVELTWIDRTVADAPALVDVVRSLETREGVGYAWFAGEAASLVPVRRHLRAGDDFERGDMDIQGYWKRGVVARDHHEPIDPEDTED